MSNHFNTQQLSGCCRPKQTYTCTSLYGEVNHYSNSNRNKKNTAGGGLNFLIPPSHWNWVPVFPMHLRRNRFTGKCFSLLSGSEMVDGQLSYWNNIKSMLLLSPKQMETHPISIFTNNTYSLSIHRQKRVNSILSIWQTHESLSQLCVRNKNGVWLSCWYSFVFIIHNKNRDLCACVLVCVHRAPKS